MPKSKLAGPRGAGARTEHGPVYLPRTLPPEKTAVQILRAIAERLSGK